MAQWASLSVSVFDLPWCYLPSDFSKFYTYVPGYVHREIGFYTSFIGIFLQAHPEFLLAKPYSLFTPPQILRRPSPVLGQAKGWNFFQPLQKYSFLNYVLIKPHQDTCRLCPGGGAGRLQGANITADKMIRSLLLAPRLRTFPKRFIPKPKSSSEKWVRPPWAIPPYTV